MSIQSNYPYDLKKQVVEMFLEGYSAAELATKFEIKNQRRVYDWVEKVRAEGYSALNNSRGQKSKGKSKKKKTLEEEFELLKLENEYLKKLLDLKKGVNDKEEQYAFIHAYSTEYPVTKLVEITEVSRSGYYKWLKRNGSNNQDRIDESLFLYIHKIFTDNRGTVGRKRIKIGLKKDYGLVVNEKRISRIMRKYGLQCKVRRKKFKNRPQPNGLIPNILDRNFRAMRPGIKLAIDITYIEVEKGSQKWMYLCAIKDLFNGEIVAHSLGTNQGMKLVYRALDALKKRGFENRAIMHSDQGTQFTNHRYMKRLQEMGISQSMSRRGNCWDNACIENFFGHLKCEMPCFSHPETVIEVRQAVEAYIHYYNNKRIQTKLEMSPVEYRTQAA